MCQVLNNRTTKSIGVTRKRFVGLAASRWFQGLEIRCDGEKGIPAVKDEHESMGISVQTAGTGQHALVAERMIQTVKQRLRAYENTLPFTMDRMMLTYSSASLPQLTSQLHLYGPHEQFSGLRLDAKRDLRVDFGDNV